jgi:hypothetical protein
MEALIAALLTAILGGLGVSGRIERGVETRLRQQMPDVKELKVVVHRGHRSPVSRQFDLIDITLAGFTAGSASGGLQIGGGGDLVGKVGKVAIHARDFRISGGAPGHPRSGSSGAPANDLTVERLEVSIKDIRYNLWKAVWRRKLRIMRVGDSETEAWLRASALTNMLAPRVKQVEHLQLRFGEGRLQVSGNARAGLRIPVRLDCCLAAVGGKIYVVDPRAHVSVVPVPSFIVTRLLDEINPLVDLNRNNPGPFLLDIDQIEITPQSLRLHAALRPRSAQAAKPKTQ